MVIMMIISWKTSIRNSSLSSWLTFLFFNPPNKFIVLPEYGRGRPQFWQTCFAFITVSRLWSSLFFHQVVSTSRLVLVHTACVLPWWGGTEGRVHLAILLAHLSPITVREFLSIYCIIAQHYLAQAMTAWFKGNHCRVINHPRGSV